VSVFNGLSIVRLEVTALKVAMIKEWVFSKE